MTPNPDPNLEHNLLLRMLRDDLQIAADMLRIGDLTMCHSAIVAASRKSAALLSTATPEPLTIDL